MADTESSAPPAKRPRFSFQGNVIVLVGPSKERFDIHPDIVSAHSPFFAAACAARWKSADEPVLLADDKAEVFNAYLECIYSKEMSQSRVAPLEQLDFLVEVYIMADKLLDIKTANNIMDNIIQTSEELCMIPTSKAYCAAWNSTPETSPLRRLLIDYYVHEINRDNFISMLGKVPHEVIAAVATEFRNLRDHCDRSSTVRTVFMKSMVRMPMCRYHQHDDANPACESKPPTVNSKKE